MHHLSLIVPYLRFFVLLSLAGTLLWFLQRRWNILASFASEQSSALNLAVFRIAVVIGLWNEIQFRKLLQFTALSNALLFPPKGWSAVAAHIPRTPALVEIAYAAFLVCGFLTIAGLFGRWACLGTALSSFYLLTLPQLFGKVNHYHHLIFFCFLLAFLPSFDTLSLDSLRAAVRGAERGVLPRLRPSTAYAFGLKVAFVTIGLIYFFPGAWKVCRSWPYWFTARNMAEIISVRLLELHPNQFQLGVLRMPAVLLLSASAAALFELAMIFLVLVKRIRPWTAIAGLMFHNITNLLMGIGFAFLQICYVAFLDWTGVFRFLANRFRIQPLTIVYDPNCALCKRTAAILCNLDWLDLLNFVPNTRTESLSASERAAVAELAIDVSFTAIDADCRVSTGYFAYRALASRIVAFWPARIFLGLPWVERAGVAVYSHVSRSRTCGLLHRTAPVEEAARPVVPAFSAALAYLFVGAMICLGVAHGVNCWPVACYPTFDMPPTGEVSFLSLQAYDADNRRIDAVLSYDARMQDLMGSERWDGLVQRQIRHNGPSAASAAALVDLWRTRHDLGPFRSATLSVDSYQLDPFLFQKKFVSRTPIQTLLFQGEM